MGVDSKKACKTLIRTVLTYVAKGKRYWMAELGECSPRE